MLTDWINDVLVEERIIVKQLEEDLYDGQVLQKLLGESVGSVAPPGPRPSTPQRATALGSLGAGHESVHGTAGHVT